MGFFDTVLFEDATREDLLCCGRVRTDWQSKAFDCQMDLFTVKKDGTVVFNPPSWIAKGALVADGCYEIHDLHPRAGEPEYGGKHHFVERLMFIENGKVSRIGAVPDDKTLNRESP